MSANDLFPVGCRCEQIAQQGISRCTNGAEEDGDFLVVIYRIDHEIEGCSLEVGFDGVRIKLEFLQLSVLCGHSMSSGSRRQICHDSVKVSAPAGTYQ